MIGREAIPGAILPTLLLLLVPLGGSAAPVVSGPRRVPPIVLPPVLDEALLALDQARPAEAVRVLTPQLHNAALSVRQRELARLLLGKAELARGRGRAARRALDTRFPGLGALQDEVTFLRGEAALLAGDPAAARPSYQLVVGRFAHSPRAPQAAFRLADCDRLQGRTRQARTALLALLAQYPEVPWRERARLQVAQTLLAEGQRDQAARLLQERVASGEDPQVAQEAAALLAALAGQGVVPAPLAPEERLAQAGSLRYWKRWDEADLLLRELASSLTARGVADDAFADRVILEQGSNLLGWGRPGPAREVLLPLQGRLPPRQLAPLLLQAEEQLGHLDAALVQLGLLHTGATLLAKREELLAENGDYAAALTELEQRGRLRPQLARTRDFRFQKAWYLQRQGLHGPAGEVLAGLAAEKGPAAGHRSRYWLGRVLARQGRLDEARAVYQQLVEAGGFGYYVIQAANRLAELDPDASRRPLPSSHPGARLVWEAPAIPPLPLPPDDPAPRQRSLEPRLALLQASHGRLFPGLERARPFAALGDGWSLRRELRAIAEEVAGVRGGGSGLKARQVAACGGSGFDRRRSPRCRWGSLPAGLDLPGGAAAWRRAGIQGLPVAFTRSLGEAFHLAGDPHWAIRFTAEPEGLRRTPPDGPQREAWARAFPRAHARWVLAEAAPLDLQPQMIWAVMTMESLYNPEAVSRSDARGLMQVIPKTGSKIARELQPVGYAPALLFEPEVAIRFACWYLRQLLIKFQGQELLAFAAYNAGPHHLQDWMARKPGIEADELLEELRWNSARIYAQRVLSYLAAYRRIYDGVTRLYHPLTLEPRVAENIRF